MSTVKGKKQKEGGGGEKKNHGKKTKGKRRLKNK